MKAVAIFLAFQIDRCMYVIHMKHSKTLRGPPFIPYSLFFRKWASFTFLDFPLVPKDRFK